MNTDRQVRALATRDAHLALMDLKRVVDEAAETVHAAELEAVHLAIRPRQTGDISTKLRLVMERLGSPTIEITLSKVREKLQNALL